MRSERERRDDGGETARRRVGKANANGGGGGG